ncbi:serine hydrolase domain-containing protein [Sinomonas terrae]|uniref:Beta-lactamase family protein n=1 Tax=Sinomonas terrae TaxID=2908838 RepID=A0ABS9TZP9_9MICC|nr:serine hydrolase domain-containing protein [Sinomonas terrae]MCH6469853.1 beta-lactamase family protein [Sinomonas terrae]
MARTAGALLLALLLTGCQYSGSTSSSTPGPTLSPAIAPLDEQARLFIGSGAVSAVVQVEWPGGQWSHAYGVRDLATKDPAQPVDRVSVGSVTETFTAVTVLKLVDDRLIGLDDPVNSLIPGFEAELHPPGPITVRELLGQTSGIPSYIPASMGGVDFRPALAQPLTLEQALRDAGGQPWPASGVGQFQWDETNYIALGLLVQTLRKKPFPDVLNEEVIAPLGLAHTSTAPLDLSQKDILHGYMTLHGQRIDTTDNIHQAGSSSEGIISTAADVNTFLGALFGGRLLSPTSVAAMEKGASPAPYALGIWKGPQGCTSSGSFHLAGNQEDALTSGVSSSDGKYTATMAVIPPPLPGTPEDPSGDRQRSSIGEQMQSALSETVNSLCGIH